MKDSHTRLRDWEEELENILIDWEGKGNVLMDTLKVVARHKQLKAFIHSILSTELESIRKEIEEKVKAVELRYKSAVSDQVAPVRHHLEDLLDIQSLLSNRIQK